MSISKSWKLENIRRKIVDFVFDQTVVRRTKKKYSVALVRQPLSAEAASGSADTIAPATAST